MPIDQAQLSRLKSNLRQTFSDINDKKAKQFVSQVLSIGRTESQMFAPIEYGNLVNSISISIDVTPTLTEGTLTYNANYAAALNNRTDWKPRPPNMKAGPAWNPNATPHYLEKGFESPDAVAAIDRAKEIFRI